MDASQFKATMFGVKNACWRWIKDLNISCNIIKALEENIGMKFSDIPCSNIFTDMSPRVKDIKERINK